MAETQSIQPAAPPEPSAAETMDRSVLVALVTWGGQRADPLAGAAELAAQVATIRRMRFAGLNLQQLRTLAQIRGVKVGPKDDARAIIRALKGQEGLRGKLDRKRRRLIGKLVEWLAGEEGPSEDTPDADGRRLALRQSIEDRGLVGGLANQLRGAADAYVAAKLDEIEQRIDRKLDQIDRRLAEWRDQEIRNRLRIIKITLVVTVVVALISVAMAWLKKRFGL